MRYIVDNLLLIPREVTRLAAARDASLDPRPQNATGGALSSGDLGGQCKSDEMVGYQASGKLKKTFFFRTFLNLF